MAFIGSMGGEMMIYTPICYSTTAARVRGSWIRGTPDLVQHHQPPLSTPRILNELTEGGAIFSSVMQEGLCALPH